MADAFLANEQAIELADEEDLHSRGLAFLRLGVMYWLQKEVRKALSCYSKSLELCERIGN